MGKKRIIRNFLKFLILSVSIFVGIFLYHMYFEPFRSRHEGSFRWLGQYEAPDKVTIIEKKEQVTISENDFIPKLIVNSQGIAVTIIASSPTSQEEMQMVASGFFVTNDGVVAIPRKDIVVRDDLVYRIYTVNGEMYEAVLIGEDPFTETVFFRTGKGNSPVLANAPEEVIVIGKNALILGRSREGGTLKMQTASLSEWAKRTSISEQSVSSSERYEGVILVEGGNVSASGSAVVTYQGELLGMVRELTLDNRVQSVIIPAKALEESLRFLSQSDTEAKRPFLGLSYSSLTPELAYMYGLKVSQGAWVKVPNASATVVLFGSPAQKSGIQQGDIITAVNGVEVTLEAPLANLIAKFHPGESINLSVYRKEKTMEISVTLGSVETK